MDAQSFESSNGRSGSGHASIGELMIGMRRAANTREMLLGRAKYRELLRAGRMFRALADPGLAATRRARPGQVS